jgi:hypothetical protein
MIELIFSPEARWLWSLALIAALFFPIRKLIWVMSVRRKINKSAIVLIDEIEKKSLLRRATITAALLSFLFSILYVYQIFTL